MDLGQEINYLRSIGWNGDSSQKYPTHAAVPDKVIWLRGALSRDSPYVKSQYAINGLIGEKRDGAIEAIATEYGRQSFFLAVYETCKKVIFDPCHKALARSVLPYEVFVAIRIHEAWEGYPFTDATNILCYLAAPDIPQIKRSYHSLFGVELEVDIKNFTDGPLQKLLLERVRPASAVHGDTDVEMVDKQQHENQLRLLYKNVFVTNHYKEALVDTLVGIDEKYRSRVVSDFAEKYEITLEQVLSRAPGPFEDGVVTLTKCAVNRPLFFAEELGKAMRDPTREMRIISRIDHQKIVRIITTVAERDLMKIKDEYLKNFGSALEADVSHAFSGRRDLQYILLLLNPNQRPLDPVTFYGRNNYENGSFSRANCSRSHLPPQSMAISEDSVRNY